MARACIALEVYPLAPICHQVQPSESPRMHAFLYFRLQRHFHKALCKCACASQVAAQAFCLKHNLPQGVIEPLAQHLLENVERAQGSPVLEEQVGRLLIGICSCLASYSSTFKSESLLFKRVPSLMELSPTISKSTGFGQPRLI